MNNINGGKLSVFEFGPKVVEKKARYRDEEERKKLTYNFNTNPRLKRGHNFGVVYVTNASQEEEAAEKKKKEKNFTKTMESSTIEKKKKLELDIPEAPENRNHVGMNTSPVQSTIRPKPLTFQFGVQTDPYIDRPPSPLFWPEKTGLDKETQVEDGALFDFDVEVEPILNVLLSKVLEQSRMEVLEEEEIKEMKEKQRYFEEIRNRELMEVQKLEEAETRRRKEMEMRLTQQQQRMTILKTYQQKLFSRTIAKEYTKNLKNNVLTHLMERGVFRKPIATQYVNILTPFIHSSAQSKSINDFVVVKTLDNTFRDDYLTRIKNLHKESKERESKRLRDIEHENEMKRQRKIEEKERRKLEKERKRIEEMLKKIKEELQNIFIKEVEFIDEITDIYEINGYYQNKKKNCTAIGGYIGQWVMILSYFSKKIPDFVNQDKLIKILDLFVPKCPIYYLLYKPEDLDYFKTLDPNINNIEDIIKCNPATLDTIIEYILGQITNNNVILKYFLVELELAGFENCGTILSLYVSCMARYIKSTDNSYSEKIKFLLKNGVDEYRAIGILNITSIAKPRLNPPKKAAQPKGKGPVKIEFETDFNDKAVTINTTVDSNSLLVYNLHFERMLRHNIIECCHLISKIDNEKDNMKAEFEGFVEQFERNFLNKLSLSFNNLHIFEFDVSYQ